VKLRLALDGENEGRIQVNAQTAQVDDLRLIALPSAVNCTDLFVKFTLAEWSLRSLEGHAGDVAGQLVSAAVDGADSNNPGFITVRLRLRGDCLVIEVEDDQFGPTGEAPVIEGARTGVEPLDGRGKRLWCELALPGGVNASSVPLPQREKKRSAAAERMGDETEEVDPEVMQRLLAGLGGTPPNGVS
jgi:hypothetical protein